MLATVFIVDDDPETLSSTAWLMESADLPVETFRCAKDFLVAYDFARPGCVLCDLRMPGLCGVELQEQLRKTGARIPVILISSYADVATAVRAIKAGAAEFLEKPVDSRVLLDHVRRAIRRDAAVRAREAERLELVRRFRKLTTAERRVMALLVRGHFSRDIAERLQVSTRTVEAHRTGALKKMEAVNVAQLVRMSLKLADLLEDEDDIEEDEREAAED